MKIGKREARKRFEQGEAVYCYPQQAKTEYEYLDYSGLVNPYKPCLIQKYADGVTFESELKIAEICVGRNMWFSAST